MLMLGLGMWTMSGVTKGNRDLNDAGKRATLFSVNQYSNCVQQLV